MANILFELALLDIRLPGMNGVELFLKISSYSATEALKNTEEY
ncbi:MAG: hypothetical protein AB1595_01975 [bacterium]